MSVVHHLTGVIMSDTHDWLAEKHPCYRCGDMITDDERQTRPRLGLPALHSSRWGSEEWRKEVLGDWWCQKCYDWGMKQLEEEFARRTEGRSPIFKELEDLF